MLVPQSVAVDLFSKIKYTSTGETFSDSVQSVLSAHPLSIGMKVSVKPLTRLFIGLQEDEYCKFSFCEFIQPGTIRARGPRALFI